MLVRLCCRSDMVKRGLLLVVGLIKGGTTFFFGIFWRKIKLYKERSRNNPQQVLQFPGPGLT